MRETDEPTGARDPKTRWVGVDTWTGERTEAGSGVTVHGTNDAPSPMRKNGRDTPKVPVYPFPMPSFVKLSAVEYAAISKELSLVEKALILDLARFVSYFDGCLEYANGKKILVEQMITITGMNDSTVRKHLLSLMQKEIICKARTGSLKYYMNPWIIGIGNHLSACPMSLFQDYRIRSKGGITWREYAKGFGIVW